MTLTREEAMAIVRQYTRNENLIKHMLAVEAAMRAYARRFGEDEDLWAAVGLVHDFDWEMHGTLEKHPTEGAPILRERGVEEDLVQTILSHADHLNMPRETQLARALYACDEITGLITAVALVRPSKDIRDVDVKSVKKKWKEKSFAAGVNREDVERGAEALGVDLWEHVGIVLEAMKGIAEELGLDGRLASSG
jgi:putative nucleotidyltransferase with HDIG domain